MLGYWTRTAVTEDDMFCEYFCIHSDFPGRLSRIEDNGCISPYLLADSVANNSIDDFFKNKEQ